MPRQRAWALQGRLGILRGWLILEFEIMRFVGGAQLTGLDAVRLQQSGSVSKSLTGVC